MSVFVVISKADTHRELKVGLVHGMPSMGKVSVHTIRQVTVEAGVVTIVGDGIMLDKDKFLSSTSYVIILAKSLGDARIYGMRIGLHGDEVRTASHPHVLQGTPRHVQIINAGAPDELVQGVLDMGYEVMNVD